MDKAMDALAPSEAKLYAAIFAAQEAGAWDQADASIAKLADRRLMGHVLAQRYENRPASLAELSAWLEAYGDHPEADDLYDLAAKRARKEGKTAPLQLSKPASPALWTGSATDSAPSFPIDLKASADVSDSKQTKLAKSLSHALRQKDPFKARDILIQAQTAAPMAGTFIADAEAAVAARFFFAGERTEARTLADAAARENQPMGLWLRGLIAWEQNDPATSAASFAKLAEHPSLNPPTRAAALFWAGRAQSRLGNTRQARAYYDEASHQPRSFYGLLAAQLLGRNPARGIDKDSLPEWNREHRAVLVAQQAGWRALALIQAGQTALAQEELRRLNPQGQGELQQAMLALGGFVPMPGLVVQLASLTSRTDSALFDQASYPLPPWQPRQGFTIDRALIYALMRHESRFDPTAISSQGALGLMQIMPSTATIMQASFDSDLSRDRMMDPAENLALGQRYIAHLAEQPKIGDNLILLLAAYNGGPTKMTDWAEGQKTRLSGGTSGRDPLLFLESIPSRETRTYVMRVLPHYWAYRARLGEGLGSLRQLAEGQWPRFSLSEKGETKSAKVAAVPAL